MRWRGTEMAGDLSDTPVFGGHVVERAAVAVDLLVDVGAALDHAPRIVVDDVGKQQMAFGVELNLTFIYFLTQRSAFKLPGLLEREESVAGDAPHFGKEFRLVGGRTSDVGNTRKGSCPSGFAGLNSRISASPLAYCSSGSSLTSGLPFQFLSLVLR